MSSLLFLLITLFGSDTGKTEELDLNDGAFSRLLLDIGQAVNKLHEEFDVTEDSIDLLNQKVKDGLTSIKVKLSELGKEISDYKKGDYDNHIIKELTSSVKRLKYISKQQQIEKSELDRNKKTLTPHTEAMSALLSGNRSAFHVQRSTNTAVAPAGGAIIEYDRIVVNDGGMWDNVTNMFTCTIPGVYVFHLHVVQDGTPSADTAAYIRFNDDKGQMVRAYVYRGLKHASGSASLVLQLNSMDRVYTHLSEGGILHGAGGLIHFTGYILYAT